MQTTHNKTGHEQAGADAPALLFLGQAMQHCRKCFVEWSERNPETGRITEFAAFLGRDDALDLCAALEAMKSAGAVESAEIWPANRTSETTRNRLWLAVKRTRPEWVDVRWRVLFQKYGYDGGLGR